ncbi:MAG: response regulator [Polyangiaceae bacterium]
MESSAQRLLVVEDDVAVARALSRTLARRGFSVTMCRSCTAARTLTHTFDSAVLDLDLPDGSGVDLARELIAGGKVPSVLFFTGSCDNAMLARARRIGTVVMKAEGTSPILAFLGAIAPEHAAPPQSQTTPSAKARSSRASSSSSLRRQRAR